MGPGNLHHLSGKCILSLQGRAATKHAEMGDKTRSGSWRVGQRLVQQATHTGRVQAPVQRPCLPCCGIWYLLIAIERQSAQHKQNLSMVALLYGRPMFMLGSTSRKSDGHQSFFANKQIVDCRCYMCTEMRADHDVHRCFRQIARPQTSHLSLFVYVSLNPPPYAPYFVFKHPKRPNSELCGGGSEASICRKPAS